MKTSIACPKCKGKEIYTDSGKAADKKSDRGHIRITKGHGTVMFVDICVCIGCGYVEEYISPTDLKDSEKVEFIRKNWVQLQ